jgi:hypothetical protein
MKPQRIQLSRRKGWRKPANTVVVARPSRWGNPYKVAPAFESQGCRISAITPQIAVQLFRENWERRLRQWPSARTSLEALRGKNLACWCALDRPCHADVLLELANR